MDGSMSGYYYGRPAVVPSTTWVINLMGGGGCADYETCQQNSLRVGSISQWTGEIGWAETKEPTTPMEGDLLSTNIDVNPHFRNAHHVHVPYCTEDLHTGQVVTPTNGNCEEPGCVDQWGFYFSGHLNFKNILHHILSNEPESRSMTRIMFTGTSAGAAGVFHNCDFLQSFLNEVGPALGIADVQVSCVPVGGWFMPGHTADHPDDDLVGPSLYSDFSAGVATDSAPQTQYANALWHKYLPPNCVADTENVPEPWMCGLATAIYKSISRPMYVIQNMFDELGLSSQLGLARSGYQSCPGQEFIAYVGDAMKESAKAVKDRFEEKQTDGLFLASCFDHTKGIKFGFSTTLQGHTSKDGVASWFFGDNDNVPHVPRILEDDCQSPWGGPCNPTCDQWYGGYSNLHDALVNLCTECATKRQELCGDLRTGSETRRIECLDCALNHRPQLRQAGCSEDEVANLCER